MNRRQQMFAFAYTARSLYACGPDDASRRRHDAAASDYMRAMFMPRPSASARRAVLRERAALAAVMQELGYHLAT